MMLPDTIGNLVGLIELNVSENQLTALPPSIGKLVRLERLIVRDNQLKEPPDSIKRFFKRQALRAGYSLVSQLPESIGNLLGGFYKAAIVYNPFEPRVTTIAELEVEWRRLQNAYRQDFFIELLLRRL